MSTEQPKVGLEGKLDQLAEKLTGGREDHLEEVRAMQKSFKAASLKKDLKNHDGMKLFLSTLRKREQSYTTVLANKKDLDEITRREFFAKREEIRFILSFFNVESVLE